MNQTPQCNEAKYKVVNLFQEELYRLMSDQLFCLKATEAIKAPEAWLCTCLDKGKSLLMLSWFDDCSLSYHVNDSLAVLGVRSASEAAIQLRLKKEVDPLALIYLVFVQAG